MHGHCVVIPGAHNEPLVVTGVGVAAIEFHALPDRDDAARILVVPAAEMQNRYTNLLVVMQYALSPGTGFFQISFDAFTK